MNDDELRQYIEGAAHSPLLSRDEEAELTRAMRQGDEAAKLTLIDANRRLVVAIARRYRDKGIPLTAAVEWGHAGLRQAAKRFDPTKSFKFPTYATWWVRQAITRGFAEEAGP